MIVIVIVIVASILRLLDNELRVEQAVDALRMEGPSRTIDEALDAVLLGLGQALAAQRLEPARGVGGTLKAESMRVGDFVEIDHRELGRDDLGLGIDGLDEGTNLLDLLGLDEVGLVDEHHVAELDLIEQQTRQRTLVVVVGVLVRVAHRFGALEYVVERHGIDHGDAAVEACEVLE